MIKILHIGFSSNPGGVENVVMNYYRYIDKENYRFDFLDLYGDGIAYSDEIKSLGGSIYKISNYKKHPVTAYKCLKKILKENGYDIIHIHMQSTANLIPVIAAKRIGGVVICHSHSSSTPKGILRKFLHSINVRFLRNSDVIKWACGVRAGEWMWGKHFSIDNIIPNAIVLNDFKSCEAIRDKIREKCGFEKDNIVIGFVGRFGSEKNTPFLIAVLKELLKISDKYRLITVGGNDNYDQFISEISSNNLEKYYYSAGIQKSTSDWYKAMDAFLLPSFFEGFPIVGLEAQASELPCFFSDRISKEIDVSNNCFFLPIESGCALIWAQKINEVSSDSINNCKGKYSEKYDIINAAKLLEKRYSELLSKTQ